MTISKTTKAYLLTTLPRDMQGAMRIIASKKLEACLILLSVMALTVGVNLLVMWGATGNLPSVAMNTEYWELAVRRVTTTTVRDLPATLLETMRIYLDYPAVWFTFEKVSFAEQARTLAMDTTAVFSINARYVVESVPLLLLVTVFMVLSRYRARGMRSTPNQKFTGVVSVSVPTGSSAMASALAPMACCGGTAIQSVASVMGLVATAPAAMLFSTLSALGVAALLIIGIAWMARKINSSCC